jgi:hypothetical protein
VTIEELSLLHVPVSPSLVKVVVEFTQTVVAPLMVPAFGSGSTAITHEDPAVPQLLITVYVIVVDPAEIPVTIPVVGLTVAIAVLALLHVPPVLPELVNGVVAFTQTEVAPPTMPGFGSGLIVILEEDTALPQFAETTV